VGNVYFSNYFLWQGQCRELFLREHAPQALDDLRRGAIRLVTAHASCDFSDEFAAFDAVCIRMTLARFIPCGVSLAFAYGRGVDASSADAMEVVARGRQDVKFLHQVDGAWQLYEIPPYLMEVFQRYA
jgi:enediyne core biosynthesis thioesterase